MDQDLPKFKIQKIALESNWQSASSFVCLVHSKQVRTVNPVFNMEFDGFMLTSTKNTRTVKFERALGEHTVVFIWNDESKAFIRREDANNSYSKTLCNLSKPLKKQKTTPSNLKKEKNQSATLLEDTTETKRRIAKRIQ